MSLPQTAYSFSRAMWVFFGALENGTVMASDILQKSLRELRALGISNPGLDEAVREFEQAKDDKTRLSAGDHLRATLAECIENARAQLNGDKCAAAIALYEALGAHVPADPLK